MTTAQYPQEKQKSTHFNISEVKVAGPNMGDLFHHDFINYFPLNICRLRHSYVLREPKPFISTKLGTDNGNSMQQPPPTTANT